MPSKVKVPITHVHLYHVSQFSGRHAHRPCVFVCSSVGGNGGAEAIWRISEEQRNYYTQQFRRLQPDLSKVVQGQQAKHFFEKSKLATDQLTRIWHLSDVTQDGALSLPEFLVAMHLVVARRNNVPLPSALPQPLLALLLPSLQQQQQHVMAQQQQKDNAIVSSRTRRGSSSSGGSSVVSSVPPPSTAAPSLPPSTGELSDKEIVSPSRAKEWTKFVDSPTSTVSSPGLKPVNFDFQRSAVEEDPQILHPKAVRVTPEPGRGDSECTAAAASGAAADGQAPVFLDSSSFGPTSLPPGGGKIEPPPPPPRPTRTHARSSSLDLNKFQRCGAVQHLGAPPAVPPRTSPGHVSPNKKLVYQRSAGETVTAGDMSCSSSNSAVHYSKLRPALQHQDGVLPAASGDTEQRRGSQQQLAPHLLPAKQSLPSCTGDQSLVPRVSAFEVYRKPGTDATVPGVEQAAALGNREADLLDDIPAPTTAAPVASSSHVSLRAGTASIGTKDKKEVCASIKTTRDRNTVLARLNNELNQELAEVIEERIALEMQLEQMKLFNN
ncbi:EH domain [Trinorchestia longiramus]|nr:EH domain [Trinorchestia longiramus]